MRSQLRSVLLSSVVLVACGSDERSSKEIASPDTAVAGEGVPASNNAAPTANASTTAIGGGSPTASGAATNDAGAPDGGGATDDAGGGSTTPTGGGSTGGGSTGGSTSSCDDNLPIAGTAFEAARAIGLCKTAADGTDWGLVDARFVLPDGQPLADLRGIGILASFGANVPQSGQRLLALSSGSARAPGDPDYVSPDGLDKGYTHAAPPGFPVTPAQCPGVVPGTPHDGVALEVQVRVPFDASSFSYRQNFFTIEHPAFVCSSFSDTYVALLSGNNIAFDAQHSPIGNYSSDLLRACIPGMYGGIDFTCPLGQAPLVGTGFESHAATGWLTTTAPVTPGSTITLRFAIWDAGDGILDSTVLVDDFRFSSTSVAGPTTIPSP